MSETGKTILLKNSLDECEEKKFSNSICIYTFHLVQINKNIMKNRMKPPNKLSFITLQRKISKRPIF